MIPGRREPGSSLLLWVCFVDLKTGIWLVCYEGNGCLVFFLFGLVYGRFDAAQYYTISCRVLWDSEHIAGGVCNDSEWSIMTNSMSNALKEGISKEMEAVKGWMGIWM